MRYREKLLSRVFLAPALVALSLRADPADVEGSRDYPGFPRQPGFILTDYDEDNPADGDFPVSRPTMLDADHVEMAHVRGHRYVIRYEVKAGARPPSLLQTQLYYEKLAAAAGFTAEKTGAVGDVTETFRHRKGGEETWVYLEPAVAFDVVTVVESIATTPPRLATITPTAPVIISVPESAPKAPVAIVPAPVPAAASLSPESLYKSLDQQGRVVVPLSFRPGKEVPDDASQPMVDSIAEMMKQHPEIFLRIESHTDNTGDPDDNLRLSGQRAFAVRALLMEAHVEAKRLDAVGVGGLQPIADNNTAEGRGKNRRIELVLRKKLPARHALAAPAYVVPIARLT